MAPLWGDLVQLNSGGPVMLVVGLSLSAASCCWPTDRDVGAGIFPLTAVHVVKRRTEAALIAKVAN